MHAGGARAVNESDENDRAREILNTKGNLEALRYMFEHPDDRHLPEGQRRMIDYATIRSIYG